MLPRSAALWHAAPRAALFVFHAAAMLAYEVPGIPNPLVRPNGKRRVLCFSDRAHASSSRSLQRVLRRCGRVHAVLSAWRMFARACGQRRTCANYRSAAVTGR
jgi:hypothetical protein